MLRKPVVTIYVRHASECQHDGKPFFRGCDCPKWLRYSGDACLCGRRHKGRQHRWPSGFRSWAQAEERREHAQKRLESGGEMTPPETPEQSKKRTVKDEIETHLAVKRTGGRLSKATERKLKYHLGLFEQFLSNRSKFFASDITADDVRDFRAGWKWKSGVTRQKAQQNLRGFLRRCFRDDQNKLGVLFGELGTIHLSPEDEERLEPQPFTDDEVTRLFRQIPTTFPDKEKAERMAALIHCQLSTGLAIRDAVQLERKSIKDGWLRIKRQKTRRPVRQKLNDALYQELLRVTNGNPKYIFWNGTSLPESATGLWQRDLKKLMEDTGVWIKGNLSHRFRDTAVDTWLNKLEWTMQDVARALGDTVAIVEKHYESLNKRAEDRLAKLRTHSWASVSTSTEGE